MPRQIAIIRRNYQRRLCERFVGYEPRDGSNRN
jgi:hypothetical protein